MDLPIILYDINKNIISKTSISKTNCFYFYSYINFNVEIISGDAELYSVKEIVDNTGKISLSTSTNQIFSNINNNFGYTLYIPKNLSTIILKISTNNVETYYTIILKQDNIIDETNEHYLDFLVNNNLPTFAELEPAILDEFNKSELIKRLLLDFKEILKSKGTKNSITKFLNFIGFNHENLSVFDEYLNKTTNSFTISPNTEKDIKTGNYYVLYDNFTENLGLDADNLPIRNILIQDLTGFSKHLLYAITLANKYFTSDEQNIDFFGLNYSSNQKVNKSITSQMCMNFEIDVLQFRKFINLNLITFDTQQKQNFVVNNCLQQTQNIYKSEVKTYLDDLTSKNNNEIYFIDREIFDNEVIGQDIDITKIESVFGNIIHLNLYSPKTFVEFTVENLSNPLSKLYFPKTFITDSLSKIFTLIKTSTYLINIKITDKHNNTENYFYQLIVSPNIQRIDFDTFNSHLILDIPNKLKLEIDSPTEKASSSSSAINYIVPQNLVSTDLKDYFTISQNSENPFQTLKDNSKYILPIVNKNYKLSLYTETIQIDLLENYLHIISFKYKSNQKLKLRVFDSKTGQYIFIDYDKISLYDKVFDKLYICLIDIFDRDDDNVIEETKQPYYFITTTEPSIDFNKNTYDFFIVYDEDGDDSIYDIKQNINFTEVKIPVNYDFTLFEIKSQLISDFKTYISKSNNFEIINDIQYPIIKSVFPRLVDISQKDVEDTYYLNIGDIIVCTINDNYIVNEKDVVWKIYNSFTNELIYQTQEYSLKYRVDENTCFDILCQFYIAGRKYEIMKKSVFSSFIKEIF